jgi:hypothetical protein
MKNLLITIIVICSCSCCFSSSSYYTNNQEIEASKNYVTRVVKTGHFNAIKLEGSPNVVYTQTSGKVHVEVYGSDNIVDILDVYTENGSLNVRFKKNVQVHHRGKFEVRVFSPSLDKMEIAGSGSIFIASGLKTRGDLLLSVAGSGRVSGSDIRCGKFSLFVAGSGNIELNSVRAENTKAHVAGSGKVRLSGTTQRADYSVAGSGNVDAAKLEADRVSANVAGSGNISCHAVSFLKAQREGSGSISYRGNPEIDAPHKGIRKL